MYLLSGIAVTCVPIGAVIYPVVTLILTQKNVELFTPHICQSEGTEDKSCQSMTSLESESR